MARKSKKNSEKVSLEEMLFSILNRLRINPWLFEDEEEWHYQDFDLISYGDGYGKVKSLDSDDGLLLTFRGDHDRRFLVIF